VVAGAERVDETDDDAVHVGERRRQTGTTREPHDDAMRRAGRSDQALAALGHVRDAPARDAAGMQRAFRLPQPARGFEPAGDRGACPTGHRHARLDRPRPSATGRGGRHGRRRRHGVALPGGRSGEPGLLARRVPTEERLQASMGFIVRGPTWVGDDQAPRGKSR
jgi:hypothetical protein